MKKLRFIAIFLILISFLALSGCGKKVTQNVQAVIDVQGYGSMTFELCYDKAPITVQNFVDLAEDGFYDGIIFHRIIKDFVVQAGDPTGTGFGGSDETIKGEFIANGVDNDLAHVKGVLSMARAQDYDSASSQFFICTATNDTVSYSLDGMYAAFGYMLDGEDVLDAMNNAQTDPNDRPINNIVINSITIVK